MIFSCILDKMSLFLVGIHIFYLLIRLKKNYVEDKFQGKNKKYIHGQDTVLHDDTNSPF